MTERKEPQWRIFKADDTPVTWCSFCGANVGDASDRTGELTKAMYYCEGCWRNYCDQCSYTKKADGTPHCMRCESELERLM
ncbi:MAG: hypothetical protein GY938_15045 [Ketobacter sp.]|nr:hypothetical protein [Ketobacter sp.]